MCVTTDQNIYGPPNQIKWTINGTEIDFKLHRGGLNIQNIKRRLSTTSKLTLLNLRHKDAGVYECRNRWDPRKINVLTQVELSNLLSDFLDFIYYHFYPIYYTL